MLIYCNGDSFTAGNGLVDHLYVPNYEKLSKIGTIKKYGDAKNEAFKKILQDTGNHMWSKMWEHEKKVSWPAIMGEKLNATVINNSFGGASTQAILYKTIIDLSELVNKKTLPDYVVIQIPFTHRVSIYVDNNKITNDGYYIDSLLVGWSQQSEEKDQLCKWFALSESKFGNTIRFLTDVALINSFVYSIIGYYPILTSWSNLHNSLKDIIAKNDSELNHLIKLSRLENLDPILNEAEYVIDNKVLPCGHYSQETVNRFATALADYILTLEHAKRQ